MDLLMEFSYIYSISFMDFPFLAERIRDAAFYGYILEPNVTGAESGPPGDENDPQAANLVSQEQLQRK